VSDNLFLKTLIALLSLICTTFFCSYIGPLITFFIFDLILSVYLLSIFFKCNAYKYLFFLHPFVVLISSFFFEIPFLDIGVSYTYTNTYHQYTDSFTHSIIWSELYHNIFQSEGRFPIGKVYIGTIPTYYFPDLLFNNPPEIVYYLSQSAYSLLCVIPPVIVALYFRAINLKVLFPIALYSTVSPTFLEINVSIHRYMPLFSGLFLFFICYVALKKKNSILSFIVLIICLFLSLLVIAISKFPLLFSLILFILIDQFLNGSLKQVFNTIPKKTQSIIFSIFIFTLLFFSKYLAPDEYVLGDSQMGGQFTLLSNLPVVGFLVRVIYATLSPFPWLNFTQLYLYGYNQIFFILHIFSSAFIVLMLISVSKNLKFIIQKNDDLRISILFGFSLMASLSFSAIGYHVYLAPAIPFIAPILFQKKYLVHYIYPLIFCGFFEIFAQLAQILRIVDPDF